MIGLLLLLRECDLISSMANKHGSTPQQSPANPDGRLIYSLFLSASHAGVDIRHQLFTVFLIAHKVTFSGSNVAFSGNFSHQSENVPFSNMRRLGVTSKSSQDTSCGFRKLKELYLTKKKKKKKCAGRETHFRAFVRKHPLIGGAHTCSFYAHRSAFKVQELN